MLLLYTIKESCFIIFLHLQVFSYIVKTILLQGAVRNLRMKAHFIKQTILFILSFSRISWEASDFKFIWCWRWSCNTTVRWGKQFISCHQCRYWWCRNCSRWTIGCHDNFTRNRSCHPDGSSYSNASRLLWREWRCCTKVRILHQVWVHQGNIAEEQKQEW